jgi:alkanesulfonate monooxygenase SsuD/methylene tetrahydromethanopterin reductase-like flavin-dependent oxidoreductase (luciferase family)
MTVRLGALILPDLRWSEGGDRWRRAEELGFDHAWTYDHLAWRTLRDSTWFAAIPTLVAAATSTTKIRLGTLVASPNFRHPVPFAKELMALDDIAGGRLTVGLGAGGESWDAEVLGDPPWSRRERADRFEEFVVMLDRLLRQADTSYTGDFYRAHEARMIPASVQRPRVPLAIAATGPRGMRLAAQYATAWVTTGDRRSPGPLDAKEGAVVLARQITSLTRACDDVGRDSDTIDRVVVTGPQLSPCLDSVDSFTDAVASYANVGVTDLVLHWPRPDGPFAGSLASFEHAVQSASRRNGFV